MKKRVNWIEYQGENWCKMLKKYEIIHFDGALDQTLGPSISQTKCDRDKPFSMEERGSQSDRVEA